MKAPSERDWMSVQARALFCFDAHGRVTTVNRSHASPAPRVYLGRTPSGNVWSVRADLDGKLVRALTQALAAEPTPDTLDGSPPLCLARVHELISGVSAQPAAFRGPVFRFVSSPKRVVGVAPATRDECAALGGEHAPLAELAPAFVYREHGRAAAICYSARTSHEACDAAVETVAEARGRGLASAVTRAWAGAVLESGRVPFYRTAWDNAASRGLARHLGLCFVGENWQLT